MTTTTVKYDFEPAQPSPGDDFEKFEERLMNAAAKSDKRGWSFADRMLGVDEGGTQERSTRDRHLHKPSQCDNKNTSKYILVAK